MLLTFSLNTIAAIFFRAETIKIAFSYLKSLFLKTSEHPGIFFMADFWHPYTKPIIFIVILFAVEWFQRKKQHGFEIFGYEKMPKILK